MRIDLTPLSHAIASLQRSLVYAKSPLAQQDPGLFEQFRNSCIQCFEFTYELSWKFLKRQIEQDAPDASVVDTFSYNTLIRTAAEMGIIREPASWFQYRDYRNMTSHAYTEERSQAIFEHLDAFLIDAIALLNALEKRQVE